MKIKLKKNRKKIKTKVRRTKPTPTPAQVPLVDVVVPQIPVMPKPRVPRVVSYKMPDNRRSNVEWAFEEATKKVGCDRCHVSAGHPCVGKKKVELATVHVRRLRSYRKEIGSEDYQQRHGGSTIIGKILGGEL